MREVLQYAADGYTIAEIAYETGRSASTVRNLLYSGAYKRLGATNLIDAVREGLRRAAISFPERKY